MRVRHVALFFLSVASVWSTPSSVVAATQLLVPQATFTRPPMIQGINYGNYQTAFKAGDTPSFSLYVQSPQGVPTISADFSQLGIQSPVTDFAPWWNNPQNGYLNGVYYSQLYFYSFGPLTIGADVSDGVKTVFVTATDLAGNIATTSVQVVIDNTPPTLSLSDISFSVASPKKGDTMYISGTASGTGSLLTIYQIRETLWDAKGNSVFPSAGGIDYDRSRLTAAVATSTDGSFSRIAYTLNDTVDNALARAASIKITITAYDGGGHIITTSLSVPIPQSPPPDPCAIPGTCASNVLFLPGIEGSRLYEGPACGKSAEEKLWEPFESVWKAVRGVGDVKVRDLSLDSTGASICTDIYTKEGDVIDSVGGGNIYKSFLDEMNGLKVSGTINDWKPVAYDWRLSLSDLLTNGAERDGNIYYAGNNGATSTPYIEQTLRALAATSKTHKVTIVAHSNGGLVTKALLNSLGDTEAASLVDKVILVGVPQTGTPADIGAILVGYNAGIYQHSFPIVSNAAARA
ncbi:MAG: alpha/beta hydrolase, partial [Patescibacteria group bacterium]|nr:alpha/beta hydrolase [Patescibacteria group bacterium]